MRVPGRLHAGSSCGCSASGTPAPRTFVSEEEIKHLVREGRQQGVLDQTEMEIIHSVFEFTDTPVRKVMVPRPKIFALDAEHPARARSGGLIVESGFSRIPVYEGSLDDIVGVVYVKDALRLLEKRPAGRRSGKILQPVHFVPETQEGRGAAQGAAEAAHATWRS